jgi:hypothetical protein
VSEIETSDCVQQYLAEPRDEGEREREMRERENEESIKITNLPVPSECCKHLLRKNSSHAINCSKKSETTNHRKRR